MIVVNYKIIMALSGPTALSADSSANYIIHSQQHHQGPDGTVCQQPAVKFYSFHIDRPP